MHTHLDILKNALIFFGRALIGMVFLITGIHQMLYFDQFQHSMMQEGLPYSEWLLVAMIGFELFGGLLVSLGYKTRLGAGTLLLFMLPATIVLHLFWHDEPAQAMHHAHDLMKIMSIVGGLLYVCAVGGGQYSLDGQGRNKTCAPERSKPHT